MEFRADTNLPEEELLEIGTYLGGILANELKRNPSEVRVRVEMQESPEDPETIDILYHISINNQPPNDLELYQAHQLFEKLMGYEETMLN